MEKNFYETPTIIVVAVDEQSIICESGNEPMEEMDLGDGGFTEL